MFCRSSPDEGDRVECSPLPPTPYSWGLVPSTPYKPYMIYKGGGTQPQMRFLVAWTPTKANQRGNFDKKYTLRLPGGGGEDPPNNEKIQNTEVQNPEISHLSVWNSFFE